MSERITGYEDRKWTPEDLLAGSSIDTAGLGCMGSSPARTKWEGALCVEATRQKAQPDAGGLVGRAPQRRRNLMKQAPTGTKVATGRNSIGTRVTGGYEGSVHGGHREPAVGDRRRRARAHR